MTLAHTHANAEPGRVEPAERRAPEPEPENLPPVGNQALAAMLDVGGSGRTGDDTDPRPGSVRALVALGTGSPGVPLTAADRARLETVFQADFGAVRLHEGPPARQATAAFGARAFTHGEHIVLGDDADQATLAHEAAHVVQQRGRPAEAHRLSSLGEPHERAAHAAADAVGAGRFAGRPAAPAPVGTVSRDQRGDRGFAGEQGMGFTGYRAEDGWIFLEGPSGAAGHAANAPGFDGVAVRISKGPFEVHLLDNKSLARAGNVSSASALTRNLATNLDNLIGRVSTPGYGGLPPNEVQPVLTALRGARAALSGGTPIPGNVKLIVTGSGGQSTGVTATLAAKGVQFRNLNAPPPPITPPPQTAGRGTEIEPIENPALAGQARGQAMVGAATLAFATLNAIGDWVQAADARKAWEQQRSGVAKVLSEQPWLGVLVVHRWIQLDAPSFSLNQPGRQFLGIDVFYGETPAQANAAERAQGMLWPGGEGYRHFSDKRWIEPSAPGTKPKPKPTHAAPADTGPKTEDELDAGIDRAITANNWTLVALTLNGMNNDGITSRLTGDARLTGKRKQVMTGALESMILWPPPHRVADAVKTADPAAARLGRIDYISSVLDTGRYGEPPRNFGTEKWKRAALALDGLDDADLRQYLPRDVDKLKLIRVEALGLGLSRIVQMIDDKHAFTP